MTHSLFATVISLLFRFELDMFVALQTDDMIAIACGLVHWCTSAIIEEEDYAADKSLQLLTYPWMDTEMASGKNFSPKEKPGDSVLNG